MLRRYPFRQATITLNTGALRGERVDRVRVASISPYPIRDQHQYIPICTQHVALYHRGETHTGPLPPPTMITLFVMHAKEAWPRKQNPVIVYV